MRIVKMLERPQNRLSRAESTSHEKRRHIMSQPVHRKKLSSLLSAITSSIVEAQQQMEQSQIMNLLSYFEEKDEGREPYTLNLSLPSMHPDAKPGERANYLTPYISLLPHSSLRIEKTEVEFSVSMNGIAMDDKAQETVMKGDKKVLGLSSVNELPDLQIDLNGNWGKDKDLAARFKFIVSSVDLPEGTMRMIDEVGKTNQGYAIVTKPGEES
jgi:hypothetical protein